MARRSFSASFRAFLIGGNLTLYETTTLQSHTHPAYLCHDVRADGNDADGQCKRNTCRRVTAADGHGKFDGHRKRNIHCHSIVRRERQHRGTVYHNAAWRNADRNDYGTGGYSCWIRNGDRSHNGRHRNVCRLDRHFQFAGGHRRSVTDRFAAINLHWRGHDQHHRGPRVRVGPTPPSITSVQNNYGQVSPGLPNYGLAPGSLFFVKGTNLSNSTSPGLLSSSSPGLPTTQDGVSVSVTAGGTTRQCPRYYLSPTQINAVLPGNTALGNATITVTNNGTTSAAYTIPVVQSAFGILFYNGSLAATYDLSNGLVASTNAANAGDYITLWGTGVGADAANDDRLFPQKQNDLTSIPMRAYLGSVEAQIYYRGRSQYPGVDQVIIIVPNNAPTGCDVSLSLVSGNIVSNSVTIPVAASGRTCADPGTTLSPEVFGGLAGKTTIKFGILSVVQSTSFVQGTARTDGSVGAFFQSVGGIGAASGVGSQISIGSCIIPQVDTVSSGVGTITGLDAGASIGVTGPGGSLNLTQISVPGVAAGFYLPPNSVTPPAFIPTGGGTFTFSGPGGRDVGSFNASLSMPTAFTWSSATAVTTVGRSQGVTVKLERRRCRDVCPDLRRIDGEYQWTAGNSVVHLLGASQRRDVYGAGSGAPGSPRGHRIVGRLELHEFSDVHSERSRPRDSPGRLFDVQITAVQLEDDRLFKRRRPSVCRRHFQQQHEPAEVSTPTIRRRPLLVRDRASGGGRRGAADLGDGRR